MEIEGGEEESVPFVPAQAPSSLIDSNHAQPEYPRPRAAAGGFLQEANPNLSSPLFAQSTVTV